MIPRVSDINRNVAYIIGAFPISHRFRTNKLTIRDLAERLCHHQFVGNNIFPHLGFNVSPNHHFARSQNFDVIWPMQSMVIHESRVPPGLCPYDYGHEYCDLSTMARQRFDAMDDKKKWVRTQLDRWKLTNFVGSTEPFLGVRCIYKGTLRLFVMLRQRLVDQHPHMEPHVTLIMQYISIGFEYEQQFMSGVRMETGADTQ